MRSSPRRIAGAIVTTLGVVLSVLAVLAPAASAADVNPSEDPYVVTDGPGGNATCAQALAGKGAPPQTQLGGQGGFGATDDGVKGDANITVDVTISGGALSFGVTAAQPNVRLYAVLIKQTPATTVYYYAGGVGVGDGDSGLVGVNNGISNYKLCYGFDNTQPPEFDYECAAATNVGETTATLNATTDDPGVASATFTLLPGGAQLTDNDGAPWTVNATGLTAETAYTYTVEFDPGDNTQTNAPCGFTTLPSEPDPEPDLSASVACATVDDAGAFILTITNAGDGAAVVDVTNFDAMVEDDLAVPANTAVDVDLPVDEDAAYSIGVTGLDPLTGTRNCEDVEGAVVRPNTPAAPTQVAGAVLPRTGGELGIALAGLGLILLGAALTFTSRRQLRSA